MNKKKQRKALKEQLKNFTGMIRLCAEEKIYHQLFMHPFWKEARIILTTMAMPFEIQTKPIIEQAWKENKTVAIPRTHYETKSLFFYELTDYQQQVKGTMNILEPSSTCRKISMDTDTLCIVPGLGFHQEKYRIGFGGGFYDRFLSNFPGHTISLAFHFQYPCIFLPDPYDVPVQAIITDCLSV